jgi:hypothetical protein
VPLIHVHSKLLPRKIRRKAQLTEEQEDNSLKLIIHLRTTMTVKARDRVASRNTLTKRNAKTKIANHKRISIIKALLSANIVETAIIGSAKVILNHSQVLKMNSCALNVFIN